MNVSLRSALEAYARRMVATGLYNNASEVIREARRLMVDSETGGHTAPKKSEILATLKALEPELRQPSAALRRPLCSAPWRAARRGPTATSMGLWMSRQIGRLDSTRMRRAPSGVWPHWQRWM